MSWTEKYQPTPFDNTPIEGLHFLIGEHLAPNHPAFKDRKFAAIEFPSGVVRPLWASSDPDHQAIVHLFGEMDLPYSDTRDEAYTRAQKIAEAVGYTVSKHEANGLRLLGPTSHDRLLVTYDDQQRQMVDVTVLGPNEWEQPVHPGHQLMTDEIREKLPKLGANEELLLEAVAPVKYFTPDSNWTWYASEFDGEDVFFGLVSGLEVELGYFSLSELQSVRGALGQPVERDLYYKPQTLQQLLEMHHKERSERVAHEQQPRREPLTMEHLTQVAREFLLRTGQHDPMVIIDGDLRTQMVVIEDMPPTHDDRFRQMAEIGFTLGNEMDVGNLRQMVLITEGWLSAPTEGKLPQVPPSKDPERVEVLLINMLNVSERKHHLMVLEMIRDEAGEIQEVRPHASMKETEGMTAESPLVDALLLGYLTAKQRPKD